MVDNNEGPISCADPVAHLKRLGDKTGLCIKVKSLRSCIFEVGANEPNITDALTSSLNRLLDPSRGQAFCSMALAPQPPSEENDTVIYNPNRCKTNQWTRALSLRNFNSCTLSINGYQVGPPVAATSPRSAERRCATLALGGGDEIQTLQILRAAKAVIDCEKTVNEVYDNLAKFLYENGAIQPVGEKMIRDGNARAGQLVVRCPRDTQPILTDGHETAAMLSDVEDSDADLGNDVSSADSDGIYRCKPCTKQFNAWGQKLEHRSSDKCKKNKK